MKAVVLVGGEGTRLRPLTETIPKPLVPLVDRPSLDHVLDHLARHAVHEVVLSSSYLEETFRAFIEARRGDPRIAWITEDQPLGTGGAIVNALAHLGNDAFFALNGDILTDLDLTAMLRFHHEREADVTIALHRVDDARAFGLVPTAPDGRVLEFREKPHEEIPGDINAGTYLLHPSVLDGWSPGTNISIELDVFPALIASGRRVFGFLSDAYWLDLGTPDKYLQAHADVLDGRIRGMSGNGGVRGPLLADGAAIDPSARIGRHVVVGAGASVGPEGDVDESVLHPGARVGGGAVVRRSILGPRSSVGEGAHLTGCVLAEGASVLPGAVLVEERVSAGRRAG